MVAVRITDVLTAPPPSAETEFARPASAASARGRFENQMCRNDAFLFPVVNAPIGNARLFSTSKYNCPKNEHFTNSVNLCRHLAA
jgi:hypothetical protein